MKTLAGGALPGQRSHDEGRRRAQPLPPGRRPSGRATTPIPCGLELPGSDRDPTEAAAAEPNLTPRAAIYCARDLSLAPFACPVRR
jgi:hypothetical protein